MRTVPNLSTSLLQLEPMLHIDNRSTSSKTGKTVQISNGEINKNKQKKKNKRTQPTTAATPDSKILSEAIKSLAIVLCATTSKVAYPQAWCHV